MLRNTRSAEAPTMPFRGAISDHRQRQFNAPVFQGGLDNPIANTAPQTSENEFGGYRNQIMPANDDLTDAKLAAVEARTDTKIVRLEGKIDTLSATMVARLDAISQEIEVARSENNANRAWIIGVVVGAAFAIAGLLVGMMTYGDAIFSRGMSVRDVVQAVVKEQQIQSKTEIIIPEKKP